MSEAWVVLRPMDAVEFRDGRPFSAGSASLSRTTFPRPTSTAGAITAAFGREPDRVEGPVLVDMRAPASFLFPGPADLVFHEGRPTRLAPPSISRPGVVTDLDGQRGTPKGFILPNGPGTLNDIVLDSSAMHQHLLGSDELLESIGRFGATKGADLLVTERRTGLARQGRVARAGMLYTAEFLRFVHDLDFGFACRVSFDGREIPPAATMVRLGGESRQAEVVVLPATGQGSPALPQPPQDIGRRVLVYLVTPAVFTNGWLPDHLGGGRVRSACVEGPAVTASWLTGRPGPQPAQWGVAAGSVYFVEFDNEDEAAAFVADNHGRCLAQAHHRLRTAGFGMCLTGRW